MCVTDHKTHTFAVLIEFCFPHYTLIGIITVFNIIGFEVAINTYPILQLCLVCKSVSWGVLTMIELLEFSYSVISDLIVYVFSDSLKKLQSKPRMRMVELLNQSSFWYVLLTYLLHWLKLFWWNTWIHKGYSDLATLFASKPIPSFKMSQPWLGVTFLNNKHERLYSFLHGHFTLNNVNLFPSLLWSHLSIQMVSVWFTVICIYQL